MATLVLIFPEWLMWQFPWFFTILGRIAYLYVIAKFGAAIWAPVRRGSRADYATAVFVDPSATGEPIAERRGPSRW